MPGYKDASAILLQILVDDGLKSRGNRKCLLNSKYNFIGIHTGLNDKYQCLTCIIFARKKGIEVKPSHKRLKSTATDFDNTEVKELKDDHEKIIDHT
jgi:hypothetical protein